MTAQKVCWISIGLVAAAYLVDPINDPDLWWHIVAGRWIIAHQAVPHVEIWNQFSLGIPWKAYSWSNEIVLAAVNDSLGIMGLLALKVALGVFLVGTFMYCLGRVSNNMLFGAFLGLVVLGGCDITFTLRPQCFAWGLFAWMIYAAHTISDKPRSAVAWAIIALASLVWANTHLTVALGIIAVVFWTTRLPITAASLTLPLTAGATTLFATLLTPYAGKEWTTLVSKAHHPFAHSYIREFQPPTIYIYSADILVLLLILFFAIWYKRPSSICAGRLLGGAAFCFAGFTILKFTPFALIYTAFLLADLWRTREKKSKQTNIEKGLEEGFDKLRSAPAQLYQGISVVCLLLIPVALYPSIKQPLAALVPEKAVDFILEHNLPMPILNGFDDGGYLMYRFSDQNGEPRQKVPIDGRTNVNNPEITRTFLQTLQGLPSWEEYLDLVNPKTVLWDTKFPLTAILDSHPDWCLVYPQDRKELLLSQRAVFVKSDLCEMIRGNAYAVDVKQSYLQGTTETDASHPLTFQTVLSSED